MESENVPTKVEEPKPKQKKKGKIAQVYKLHQKGISVKEISEKMNLGERLVRSYLWRSANTEKYKALLARYYTKRKAQQAKKKENA